MQEQHKEKPMSLLLLKPEFFMLNEESQTNILSSLGEHLNGSILEARVMSLNQQQAASLWENVSDFPWAGAYYEDMASRSIVFVLEGSDRAGDVKKRMRQVFDEEIKELTARIGLGYTADIFHGSEPGCEKRELALLGVLGDLN